MDGFTSATLADVLQNVAGDERRVWRCTLDCGAEFSVVCSSLVAVGHGRTLNRLL